MTLMPLLKPRLVKPFFTFDIEAENWKDFRLCGIYDGKDYLRFTSMDELADFMFSKPRRDMIGYAHNLAYDGMFILDHILNVRTDLSAKPIINGSKILSISVSDRNKHKWILRDSLSLLPESLKKLTEDFDVPHKKLDEEIGRAHV